MVDVSRSCVYTAWLGKELGIRILKNVIVWTWLTQNSLNFQGLIKISVSVTSVRSSLSHSNVTDLFKGWCSSLTFWDVYTSVIKYSVFLQLRNADIYCKVCVWSQMIPFKIISLRIESYGISIISKGCRYAPETQAVDL